MAVPGAYKTCGQCGLPLPLDQQVCPRCGSQFPPQYADPRTQAFYAQTPPPAGYPRPGYPYQQPVPVPGQDQRWLVALLLCVFLGQLGIHRFYMGYTGAGITMLCLTIFGGLTAGCLIGLVPLLIVFIWWIVDLVQICTNQLRMADGTPLRYY